VETDEELAPRQQRGTTPTDGIIQSKAALQSLLKMMADFHREIIHHIRAVSGELNQLKIYWAGIPIVIMEWSLDLWPCE
jgi:hypothetical protein